MLGKLLATLLLLGIIVFGGAWLLAGYTPAQLIDKIFNVKAGQVDSSNVESLTYHYTVKVNSSDEYNFDVNVHVVKRVGNTICYAYKISKIYSGDRAFIEGFMYGFQGNTPENTPICVDTNAGGKIHLSRYFVQPDRSGTITINTSNGKGVAYLENGILNKLTYNYVVPYQGQNIPIKLTITLVNAEAAR
jgi:hypothetical protein